MPTYTQNASADGLGVKGVTQTAPNAAPGY